jgi:arylsulfatase A-like enzyme
MSDLNILFIMTDQMRADCMSCAGHSVVETPNLDALADQGVRFPNTFVQSAVCGPSRMCFYTGRYPHANRSPWNEVPLPSDERTMGHYFGDAGYRAALCGKTHFVADPIGEAGKEKYQGRIRLSTLDGLEEFELNDGRGEGWCSYLREKGYPEEVVKNPFLQDIPEDTGGRDRSAFPTVVAAEDSDTAYMTNRAMDFMDQSGERPWFLHLSYFKPHLPIVAPYPYNEMYDPSLSPQPNRDEQELVDPHPLHVPYRIERRSLDYDEESVWRQRRATYYGLIREIDGHLGRLFAWMKERGLWEKTLICFTSDHGEYVGDHWMFEKELFYDEAYRVPFILYDPRSEADGSRGNVEEAFVESIDAVPTFLEAAGLKSSPSIQGRSLMPFARGEKPENWRTEVHADWDFRFYWTPKKLGLPPEQCRAWMIRDHEYKFWHFNGLPDVLFDLKKDPNERRNVAEEPEYKEVRQKYLEKLIDWRMSNEDVSRVAWTYERRPGFGRNPFEGKGEEEGRG